MTNNDKAQRYARILGTLLADRAGLDPATTSEEWTADSNGKDEVTVKLTTVIKMSLAEYNSLSEQAYARAS